MNKIVVSLVLLLSSSFSFSGDWVVTGASVDLIQSTTSTRNAYWIWYSNTSGADACDGKIKFVPDNGSEHVDAVTFQRGFDLTTAAMVHDLKINIWQYGDVLDCSNAVANVELRR
ncbi:DUF5992 family protein [Agaribacterium sp. ZY112]|uniref:DUF5992 family protein n=1 Tax=Agaribacterium sp. ZY112 TaxID=3233574 RepID=UPI0035241658